LLSIAREFLSKTCFANAWLASEQDDAPLASEHGFDGHLQRSHFLLPPDKNTTCEAVEGGRHSLGHPLGRKKTATTATNRGVGQILCPTRETLHGQFQIGFFRFCGA